MTQKCFAVTFFRKWERFCLTMLWTFLFCFCLPGLLSTYYGFQFCILWSFCVYIWVCMLSICFFCISLGSFNLCFLQLWFVLFYFIIFLDACFLMREQERVWICVDGKVEKIWEELGEGKPGLEYIVWKNNLFSIF